MAGTHHNPVIAHRLPAPNWAKWIVWILLTIGVGLGLYVIYKHYFSSLTVIGYITTVWDGVSLWTGRIATIAGVAIPLLVYFLRGRFPVERTWKEILPAAAGQIVKHSSRKIVVLPGLAILLFSDIWLAYVALVHRPTFPLPASGVVFKPDGSEIFIADDRNGKIRRIDAATGKIELTPIDVGGHPNRMLIGPRSGNLYILDSEGPKITVVDSKKLEVLYELAYRGRRSNSFAITPDERKMYISNEQPSPQATITVVDLAKPSHPRHEIRGFNCPEGLAIIPDGSKVYVSTQCAAGHDPLFVIDTKTDRIKTTLRDCAVGTADVAVAKRGERVYVSRGGFATADKNRGVVQVPPQISSIDTLRDAKVESEDLHMPGGAFAVSPEGRFLFFVTGSTIEMINTDTRATNEIPLGATIAGIAIGKSKGGGDLVCYAWCPDQNWIFFTGLTGLLP